ncbi:hypothetical protein CVT24_001509 [Panaeolus cyanescens]|uniref:Uncharacterized protein n=1 Tax=Panaeolus cyanescens TaxID=181874 RepID=A0A409YFA2_9AGAR|nr:hypothetical protein CVT24_001509 [Panaeolus cyanescens]
MSKEHEEHFLSFEAASESNKPLPSVAVVFISIALGFGFVLLYSFIAILLRIRSKMKESTFKLDADRNLAEAAELMVNKRDTPLSYDKHDSQDEEEEELDLRAQEDGLDVVDPRTGDGSVPADDQDTSTNQTLPTAAPASHGSDGKDLQRQSSKGKKPVRNKSIQDGAAEPRTYGPLDDLKAEIERQLSEIEEESSQSTLTRRK